MSGSEANVDVAASELKRLRVGGNYWGPQPSIPTDCLVATSDRSLETATRVSEGRPVVSYDGEADPWHVLSNASALVAEAGDELHVVAALLGCPRIVVDKSTAEGRAANHSVDEILAEEFGSLFENPFTGEAMDAVEAIRLCGFWRELIDSNRDLVGGLGFAFWKQRHVAPLLWGGGEPFKFLRNVEGVDAGARVALWRSKVPEGTVAELEAGGAVAIEVEDGFLRSRGLGADCIPPLSITVDRLRAYFDPSQDSELERLLENGQFDEPMLERARRLRNHIVKAGLGKYDSSQLVLSRPAGKRRHILVPGQVEDDRAVTLGGCGLVSNLDLLKRVREEAPQAYILYKPHPDVVAGHRRGSIADATCLKFADEIVGDVPIIPLIGVVDEVHVNTSLAGFEALLREKPVTTYGVPFYAGWGLTSDLGPVPKRRTAKRSLDELVAAALLIYPRYFDPITGLPCPAEIVVRRLSEGKEHDPGLFVGLRRIQGKVMRRLRNLVQ